MRLLEAPIKAGRGGVLEEVGREMGRWWEHQVRFTGWNSCMARAEQLRQEWEL